MLLCLIFSFRQSTDSFLDQPWYESLIDIIHGAQVYVAASLPMLVLISLADRHTSESRSAWRIAAFALAVVAGAAAYAAAIGVLYDLDPWGLPTPGHMRMLIPLFSYFLRALLMGGLLAGVLYYVTRETVIGTAIQTSRLTRIALDRQMAEARLRVLQAQIEPHFLFNTLAHIKRLYLIEPGRGEAMLHDLSDYLRAALPQMRERESTLGRELALARAYLNVLRARMGERLEVNITVPDALLRAEFPPMMLSTLVENAIKHGITPLRQGGIVKILAARDGGSLQVSVADNGTGFQEISGSGVGLANTRARLAALYGANGRLVFEANPVRGVTVRIELPYIESSGYAAAA